MFKTTDIASLGNAYSVADAKGNIMGAVQVVPFMEILNVTLGPYVPSFESYAAYIEKCVALLSGFDDIDPHRILWYATSEEEVALTEVIEYAIKHEYDVVILEHLADLDE